MAYLPICEKYHKMKIDKNSVCNAVNKQEAKGES